MGSLCVKLFMDTNKGLPFVSLHMVTPYLLHSTSERFYPTVNYPIIKRGCCKLVEITHTSYLPCVSPTLSNLSPINLCATLSSDPADITRPAGRLVYVDVLRVGVSDPSYQCQAVSADSSIGGEAAAAAHPDSGAVTQRSVQKNASTVR